MAPTHVYVTAAPGKEVPFSQSEASAPGMALLIAKPGKVHRVPYSTSVRRRINAGDLRLVNKHGQVVKDAEHAKAEDGEIETDDAGAIAGVTVVNTEGSTDPIVTADSPRNDEGHSNRPLRRG